MVLQAYWDLILLSRYSQARQLDRPRQAEWQDPLINWLMLNTDILNRCSAVFKEKEHRDSLGGTISTANLSLTKMTKLLGPSLESSL